MVVRKLFPASLAFCLVLPTFVVLTTCSSPAAAATASGDAEVPTWNWSHWVDTTFDVSQMEGNQSDPVERWTLDVEYSNIKVQFSDSVVWTSLQGVTLKRREWVFSLTYRTENGTSIESRYGVRGFYFGTRNGTTTPQDLGRTEPPYNVGVVADFENRSNSDVSVSQLAGGNGTLLEFNVSYDDVKVYLSDEYSVAANFSMIVAFHVYHRANDTRVKVDTILDWFGVDWQSLNEGEVFFTSMHNDYSLQNLDTGEEIYPYGTPEGGITVFKQGGFNVSGFDLGDNYTVEYKNGSSEDEALHSVIEYEENVVEGHSLGMQYYYWTLFHWTDADVSRVVYDPTITVATGAPHGAIGDIGWASPVPGALAGVVIALVASSRWAAWIKSRRRGTRAS
ncbi:MAG: hypothetical protein ACTSU5_22025 [Promethearchaeota archaeon]